jgi:processive 1,2-diacylglycerol beta-glucosyltransferase/1,2-diacylglycerol 3-beta-galactosyltransferase
MKRKYLFFYLKTGGGHLAPAKAIASVVERDLASDAEVVLVDGLQDGNKLARIIIEDGYRFLQASARWYYAALYFVNKFSPLGRWTLQLAALFLKPVIRKRIEEEKPDRIVIFHFLLVKPVHDLVRKSRLPIEVITAVTDPFTAHPLWFITKGQQFILFSDQLKATCMKKGVPETAIHVFPFPVSLKFSHSMAMDEILQTKKRLNLEEGRKVVLIFGGADGIPRGARILRDLSALTDVALLIVCGRNINLYHQAVSVQQTSGHRYTTVFGFVDFIYDLISVSDLVISKCGASTFKEILLLGKIPIVTDYIWEQEKGNVEFLQKHKFGYFEPDLGKLPGLVNTLLNDEKLHSSLTSNIRNAGLRNGAEEIAHWLVERKEGG